MKLFEIDEEMRMWISERPPEIQEMCAKWPPNLLYRIKSTGQRVTLVAYAENGTVTVDVSGEHNLHAFDCEVFGVNPHDLEECDGPAPGEPVGCVLQTPEQIEAYIDESRDAILGARRSNPDDPYGKVKQ